MAEEPRLRIEIEALRPTGAVFRRAVVPLHADGTRADIVAECNRLRGEIRNAQGWTPQFRILSFTSLGVTDLTHLYAAEVN
jgi:hypothetical protein